jgi:glycosyltransferase involved in cell wall biosynthesis
MAEISLGIPVFNSAPFLDELCAALRCLQPLPAEIVFLDDASTDDSMVRLAKFAADPGIAAPVRLLRNKHNLGIAGSYNRLALETHGQWLQILDADDLPAQPDFFGRIASALNDEVDLVITGLCSNARLLDFCARTFAWLVPHHPPHWWPLLGSVATRAGVLYRRTVLLEHPFANPAYPGSDIIHLLGVRKPHRCVFLRRPRVFYRVHSSAQSSHCDRDYTAYRTHLARFSAPTRWLHGLDLRLRQVGQSWVR